MPKSLYFRHFWAFRKDQYNGQEEYGEVWALAYKTLAELYEIPVVGVSNVDWIKGGAWDGWKCIGSSLAVGSNGKIIAKGRYGVEAEELLEIKCQINTDSLKGTLLTDKLEMKGYQGP